MALVKKLNPGGSIDKDALNTAIINELGQFKLRAKDERQVRTALDKVRSYLEVSPDRKLSIDPVTQTFTVTGPESQTIKGSPDQIKNNWLTGNLSIKDEDDAMSVAATVYHNALKTLQPTSQAATNTTTNTSTKAKLNIPNITNFAYSANGYGSEAGFSDNFLKLETDDDRKKAAIPLIKKNIDLHIKEALENKDKFDYVDLQAAQDMQKLLDSPNPDWNKINEAGYKFNWNLNDFLTTPDQRATFENAHLLAKQKADQQQATDVTNLYHKLHISGSLADQLAENKYYETDDSWTPTGTHVQWISDLLSNNGAHVLKNDVGNHIIVANNQLFNFAQTDQFQPGHGYSWNNDLTTGFKLYTPGRRTSNPLYEQLFGGYQDLGNIGRELITNLPNAKVIGWSGEDADGKYARDPILGRRDYTQYLVVEQNGKKIRLSKGANGKYYNPDGSEVRNLKIHGFGKGQSNIVNYDEIFPQFKEEINPEQYDLKSSIAALKSQLASKTPEYGVSNLKLASYLKWSLNHNPEVVKNSKLKAELSDLLADYHGLLDSKISTKKDGGVLIAQAGAKFEAYRKSQEAKKQVEAETPKVMKDIRGTWKDQTDTENALDVASAIGMGASFIPGVGAIGAGVSTIADAIKGATDSNGWEWKDTGTLAMNLGVVGLSLFGLGGIGALTKAAKASTVGFDIAKIAKNASKVEKLLTPAEKLALNSVVDLSKSVGAKTTAELIAKATPETEKTIKEGLNVLNVLKNSSNPKWGTVGMWGKGLKDGLSVGAEGVGKVVKSKYVREPIRLALMAPGVKSGYDIVHTAATDGLEYVKPSDFKDVIATTYLGKMGWKDFKGVRAIERQAIKSETKAKNLITFGENNTDVLEIPTSIKAPKLDKVVMGIKKDKIEAKNLEKLTEFRAKVIAEAEAQAKKKGEVLPDDVKEKLNQITETSLKYVPGSTENTLKLGEHASNVTGNRTKDVRDYNLAKKYLGEQSIVKPTKTEVPKETPIEVVKKTRKPRVSKPISETPPIRQIKGPTKSMELMKKTNTPIKEVPEKQYVQPKPATDKHTPAIDRLNASGKTKSKAQTIAKTKTTSEKKPIPVGKVTTINTPYKGGKYNSSRKGKPQKSHLVKHEEGGILKFANGTVANVGWGKSVMGGLDKSWKFLKKGAENTDMTDLANISMFFNTLAANKQAGVEQRNAAAAGVYSLPMLPKTYTRITSPYRNAADEQATSIQSQAKRISNSTSDLDKGIAVQLTGIQKSNDAISKGQMADQQRADAIIDSQQKANARIDIANLETIGKNKATFANATKSMHLVNANEALSQSNAFGNLMIGLERNVTSKNYKGAFDDYIKTLDNPEYQKAIDAYETAGSDKNKEIARQQWLENSKITSYKEQFPTFESSPEYSNFIKGRSDAQLKLNPFIKDQQKAGQKFSFLQQRMMFGKSGGTLSKQDRIEIENAKHNNKLKEKDMELTYKAIMHNNEMLQKALLKIFK